MGVGNELIGVRVVTVAVTAAITLAALFSFQSQAEPSVTGLDPTELRALALQATLRVEARTCDGFIRGSGFVVDGEVVTNRHLVEDAAEAKIDGPIATSLQPVTWMSDHLDVATTAAPPVVGLRWADQPVGPGDVVLLAGHAGGGSTELIEALVSIRAPGESYGATGEVLLIDGRTSEGFSGGPVLNQGGGVVAILSGFDPITGLTIAVPADRARLEIDARNESPGNSRLTVGELRPTVCG